MVKNQIIVGSVVSQGLGVRAIAKKYGVCPARISTLVARYLREGPSALVKHPGFPGERQQNPAQVRASGIPSRFTGPTPRGKLVQPTLPIQGMCSGPP